MRHPHIVIYLWIFKSRDPRNNFMNDTVGIKKGESAKYFSDNYE